MKDKKKLLKRLGMIVAVITVLLVAWLIYKPFFWAGRGIDPMLYKEQGMTAYEWIEANAKEQLVFEKEITNQKTGEVYHFYDGDALREYLPNCNENKQVSFDHRANDEWKAWEVGYTYGYHQGTYIRYYEDGSEEKTVSFGALWLPNIFHSPDISIHVEP